MADSTPPIPGSMTLPGTVNLAGPNPSATFTLTATDDMSGVHSVVIFFDKAISYLDTQGNVQVASGFFLDPAGGNSYSITQQLSQFASPGTYHVTDVQLRDKAGNLANYNGAALDALGINRTFTFTGGTPDSMAPVPTALGLPSNVDLNAVAPTATFSATVTDDVSGVYSVVVFFDKAISYIVGGSVQTASGFFLDPVGNGTFSHTEQISQFASPGVYRITDMQTRDKAGNLKSYNGAELIALGLDTAFTFTGGTADTAPPVPTTLGLPANVNPSGTPTVTFSAGAVDDISGVQSVVIFFDRAISYLAGGTLQTASGFFLDPSGNGSHSISQQLSQLARHGTYHVTDMQLRDKAGNLKSYGINELTALGFNTEFTFTDGVTEHAPAIISDGGGMSAALAAPENSRAVTTVVATDADAGSILTYSIVGGADGLMFQINPATGALSFTFAPDFENPFDADHNNSYLVRVRASDGSFTDDQVITVLVTDVAPASGGDDGDNTLLSTRESETIDGRGGDDTVVFSSSLAAYSATDQGSKIFILGPDGLDTLISIEHLRFADGTINVEDGSALFDTVFYSISNPDVFLAGGNALAHFNAFGWQEGRDPNQFFDTSWYRSVYKDAAGVNPLDQYHTTGWKKGYDPGPFFDTKFYLVRNPDVAAAGIDPLEHYLRYGANEGRAIHEAIGDAMNGFDAQYYLLHNPDVAASGVDPLQHFNTNGWHEGRNPNAYFDTAGYLSHYADIAASGVNPLQHYQQFGWHEGRDPSAQFDTLKYLAANPDVAAADINPLDHFLQNGIYEGRIAISDGLWH